MHPPVTPLQWSARVRSLERDLRETQAAVEALEHRAALAERSAREAWQFVKALRGTPHVRNGNP
jgi:hypothetical protein